MKKNFFLENLAWPFRPVRNANRKNGLTFYSSPWKPFRTVRKKKKSYPILLVESIVMVWSHIFWSRILLDFFHAFNLWLRFYRDFGPIVHCQLGDICRAKFLLFSALSCFLEPDSVVMLLQMTMGC